MFDAFWDKESFYQHKGFGFQFFTITVLTNSAQLTLDRNIIN